MLFILKKYASLHRKTIVDNMSIKQREQIKFYLHDLQTTSNQEEIYKDTGVNDYLNNYDNKNTPLHHDK